MIWIALTALFLVGAFVLPKMIPKPERPELAAGVGFAKVLVGLGCILAAIFCVASTSYIVIGPDSIGHKKRLYFGEPMLPGQVIAMGNERGKLAETIPPGLKLSPFLNVLYTIEEKQEVVIPKDQFAMLVAAGGRPLRTGQIMSDKWPDDPNEIKKMLDAKHFLERVDKDGQPDPNGIPRGQKGMQNVILPPGNYRFNKYLFEHELGPVTEIEPGFVGVVKSNIQEVEFDQQQLHAYQSAILPEITKEISTELVPRGYKGVWGEYLTPGKHWMHKYAYQVTPVDTRIKTLNYLGGFTRRYIDLEFDQEGNIKQKERHEDVPVPAKAADNAIAVKVEGWEIPVEVRIQVQIRPEHAPLLVATVGTLENMEENVMTPMLRSILRDVAGAKGRSPLDLMNQREIIRRLVQDELDDAALQYGVTLINVQIGEPAIPPELLVAQRRKQISGDLLQAYQEEKLAQDERIKREKAKAEADQQQTLVAAQIKQQAAEFEKQSMQLQGEGEKLKLSAIAEGQKAQAMVLGEENVLLLAAIDKILERADMISKIKLPEILVMGEGGGLAAAAAMVSTALQKAAAAPNKAAQP